MFLMAEANFKGRMISQIRDMRRSELREGKCKESRLQKACDWIYREEMNWPKKEKWSKRIRSEVCFSCDTSNESEKRKIASFRHVLCSTLSNFRLNYWTKRSALKTSKKNACTANVASDFGIWNNRPRRRRENRSFFANENVRFRQRAGASMKEKEEDRQLWRQKEEAPTDNGRGRRNSCQHKLIKWKGLRRKRKSADYKSQHTLKRSFSACGPGRRARQKKKTNKVCPCFTLPLERSKVGVCMCTANDHEHKLKW